MTDFDYGFESSSEIKIDVNQFPVGKYKVFATEQSEAATGFTVKYEIVTGDLKGDVVTIWYNTKSDRDDVRNIAKKEIRRIADVTRVIDSTNPIKGRAFCVEVEKSKKNEQYTIVTRYSHADEIPDEAPLPKAKAAPASEEIPFS